MSEPLAPALRKTAADHAALGLQAITSAVDVVTPGLGSFFGTLIGEVIPGQRTERMVEYFSGLSRRIRLVEGAVEGLQREGTDNVASAYAKMAENLQPTQRALFEDGAIATTRATSSARIEGIARIVADGLNADEAQALEQRRVLQLLNELSEDEIVVLCSYTMTYGHDELARSP